MLILAIAAVPRLARLDVRPMHADEAILADKFGTLLERGMFEYDPGDYHGPVLEYATLPSAWIRGQSAYVALDEWTLRLIPALAGACLAITPLLFASATGPVVALVASLLLATSTPLVFYSRYYIPEMLLALLTALSVAALWRWERWWAAGMLAGLAVATKETAGIAIVAMLAAALVRRPRLRQAGEFVIAASLAPLILIGPAKLLDAGKSYMARGTSGAEWHAHPWHYYLGLLGAADLVLLGLAIAGAVVARRDPLARFFAAYAVVMGTIYFVIPYKTPWCAVSLLWPLAMLAGFTAKAARERAPASATVALVLLCGASGSQAWTASTDRSADPARNQWIYAQTSPEVFRITEALTRLSPQRDQSIGVYSRENLWPLPWYFRQHPGVRWSREVTIAGVAPPIVITTAEQVQALTRKFYEGPPPGERELYVPVFEDPWPQLRPGVPVQIFATKSVWDLSQRTSDQLPISTPKHR